MKCPKCKRKLRGGEDGLVDTKSWNIKKPSRKYMCINCAKTESMISPK